jgi:glucose-1-phosphate cytidylyltransferase
MKALILAGGLGTRLREETEFKPKPMVEVGGRPILWHIMKIYSSHGINDFIICCGYKGYIIKEYFANYLLHMSDVSIEIANNSIEIHNHKAARPRTKRRILLIRSIRVDLPGAVISFLARKSGCCCL